MLNVSSRFPSLPHTICFTLRFRFVRTSNQIVLLPLVSSECIDPSLMFVCYKTICYYHISIAYIVCYYSHFTCSHVNILISSMRFGEVIMKTDASFFVYLVEIDDKTNNDY